ncbi:MAG: nitrogenase molybdenum-iron protein subunit beta [Alphaproteobacteria bacterium]|nr:nitrogenase molybdenum-iron protein subunit beta [Alphaproteobacteria bacterium]
MPQNAEKIKDHVSLFAEPEYKELFERKATQFECGHSPETVAKQADYTKGWEYREKNLARQAVVINPAKACQPLGAAFAAAGFEGTLVYTHGSQGCTAYFRSHLTRHFKEPTAIVSDSMTEDAAVFGGLNNMVEGLSNAYALYKPKMIAVHTTCMAEVIGDDLHAFIQGAKDKGSLPQEIPVPFAHTPSFVGSHVVGYDLMVKGVLSNFWEGKTRTAGSSKINLIPGFDGYAVANVRELKRMMDAMGVEYTVISDVSDIFDTPTDGKYRMFDGGTKLEDVAAALDAKATIGMQRWCGEKTLDYVAKTGQETASFRYPLGVSATDEFLMKVSELTGKPIPASLELERGRLVDAIADSIQWTHGKTFAIYGDPDFVLGMSRFVMEMGGEPVHCLSTNGTKDWAAEMTDLLATSPHGAGGKAWAAKDLWAMRSLIATEPVDFVIGNSYGKYLEREFGVPLIRLTFPIFDRHHHHRFPTMGYQGGLRVLVTILDKILDTMDVESAKTGISYDLVR